MKFVQLKCNFHSQLHFTKITSLFKIFCVAQTVSDFFEVWCYPLINSLFVMWFYFSDYIQQRIVNTFILWLDIQFNTLIKKNRPPYVYIFFTVTLQIKKHWIITQLSFYAGNYFLIYGRLDGCNVFLFNACLKCHKKKENHKKINKYRKRTSEINEIIWLYAPCTEENPIFHFNCNFFSLCAESLRYDYDDI